MTMSTELGVTTVIREGGEQQEQALQRLREPNDQRGQERQEQERQQQAWPQDGHGLQALLLEVRPGGFRLHGRRLP